MGHNYINNDWLTRKKWRRDYLQIKSSTLKKAKHIKNRFILHLKK